MLFKKLFRIYYYLKNEKKRSEIVKKKTTTKNLAWHYSILHKEYFIEVKYFREHDF